jgi:hypothetical protein
MANIHAMRFLRSTFLTLPFCLTVSLPLAAQEETLDWHNNYKEAIAEAKRTQQPIFLEYRCEP